jgi:hypothetical protein
VAGSFAGKTRTGVTDNIIQPTARQHSHVIRINWNVLQRARDCHERMTEELIRLRSASVRLPPLPTASAERGSFDWAARHLELPALQRSEVSLLA